MVDSVNPTNTVTALGETRSTKVGDLPEDLTRRYYLDGRGGRGLGVYTDARIKTAAFRDQGRALVSVRTDPKTIRDMARVAQHRGWTTILVAGNADFRREAWMAAKAAGLDVRGYQPTERDRQEQERTQARHTHPHREMSAESKPDIRADRARAEAVKETLRVVGTVVRARVSSVKSQERIIDLAGKRLTEWLDRGAQLKAATARQEPLVVERASARQRER